MTMATGYVDKTLLTTLVRSRGFSISGKVAGKVKLNTHTLSDWSAPHNFEYQIGNLLTNWQGKKNLQRCNL